MPSSGPFKIGSDCWVNVDIPTKNYASAGGLSAQYLKKRILMHVPRPSGTELGNRKIMECDLQLYQKNDWTQTFTMRATLIQDNWNVANTTWNDKPALRQDARATKTFTVTGQRANYLHVFDLADLMEAAANNDWAYNGVALMCNNNPSYEARFFSKNTSGREPRVFWHWAVEPKRPTDLHPDGTRSDTTPRFTADTANVQVDRVRLQISQTADFSGSLVKNLSVYMPPSTTKIDYTPGTEFGAPLPSNAVYYWRMYYTNPEGLKSGWSKTVQMAIKTKPTVEITSVTAAITTDITPLLTWDYTPGEGGAQTRAQVRLYKRVSDLWVRIYVKNIVGTATSWEVPDDVLAANKSHRQAVRVWDNEERDHDNTDKAYDQDATEWACMPNKDTRGVDDLTATPITTPSRLAIHGIMPVMRLTWNRNEVPDFFKIYRKMDEETPKELISVGEPGDYSPDYAVGEYEFIDSVPGGADIRYFVVAVVNKKASHSTNEFEYMAGVPLTAAWTVATSAGAVAELQQLYDRYVWNDHFARVAISDGGSGKDKVQFRQDLPLAVPDSQYRITLRARSLEGDKTIESKLRKKNAPYTVYGTADVNLTNEWSLTTWYWTVTEEFELRMTLFCGDNNLDVDIDYFVAYMPGTSVIVTPVETRGFWLVPETRPKWAVPFTINVENDTEYDENVGETHPIGGKFNVVRAPIAAKKTELTALMDKDTLGIYNLERIIKNNLICRLSSSRGHYARVVLTKGLKVKEFGELHGRKMCTVSITCLEIDAD